MPNCDPEKDPTEMLKEITAHKNSSTFSLGSDSLVSDSSSEVCIKENMAPYYGSTCVGYSYAQSCVADNGDSGNSVIDSDDDRSGSALSHNSVM